MSRSLCFSFPLHSQTDIKGVDHKVNTFHYSDENGFYHSYTVSAQQFIRRKKETQPRYTTYYFKKLLCADHVLSPPVNFPICFLQTHDAAGLTYLLPSLPQRNFLFTRLILLQQSWIFSALSHHGTGKFTPKCQWSCPRVNYVGSLTFAKLNRSCVINSNTRKYVG